MLTTFQSEVTAGQSVTVIGTRIRATLSSLQPAAGDALFKLRYKKLAEHFREILVLDLIEQVVEHQRKVRWIWWCCIR